MIGFIYNIIYQDNFTTIKYIGSTTEILSRRFQNHKTGYKSWKNGKQRCISIYKYFDKYGIENFYIVELQRYEITDKQELRKYEQEWIDKTECINKNWAVRIPNIERNKIIKERQIHYCQDCDMSFPKPCYLVNHFNTIEHWKHIFPWNLDFNMERREMEWERIVRQEKQKREMMDRRNTKRRTEEYRKKNREYCQREEVKQKLHTNQITHKQKNVENLTCYCRDCDKVYLLKGEYNRHLTFVSHWENVFPINYS